MLSRPSKPMPHVIYRIRNTVSSGKWIDNYYLMFCCMMIEVGRIRRGSFRLMLRRRSEREAKVDSLRRLFPKVGESSDR